MAVKLTLNRSRQVPAEDTPAFGGIAERFRRAGDLDRAITLCKEGLRKFPDLLSARVTLGWALLDKGEYDDARKELELVIRRAPDNLAAIRGLAELHDRAETTIESSAGWQQVSEPTTSPAAVPVAPDVAPPAPSVEPIKVPALAATVQPPAESVAGPAVESVIAHIETESMLAAYLTPEPAERPTQSDADEIDPELPPQGSQWELDPPLPPPAPAGHALAEEAFEPVVSLPASETVGLEALASEFSVAPGPSAGPGDPVLELEVPAPDTAGNPFATLASAGDLLVEDLRQVSPPFEGADDVLKTGKARPDGASSGASAFIPFRTAASLQGVAEHESEARLERWGAMVLPIGPRSINRRTLARLEGMLRRVERRRRSTSNFVA